MKNAFAGYHPAVNFLYFALVLGLSACCLHPAVLAVSALCALACAVCWLGGRAVLRRLRWMVPLLLAAALLNPAFNHRGATVLAYLPSGNPLTLESVAYGLAAAALLVTVLLWCACLQAVLTSDKVLYLFGRVAPALSLVLSMALGFLPRFRAQARRIAAGQRGAGRGGGGLWQRLRGGGRQFSMLVTWALETAVDTADAMQARGHGLPGRSAYFPFHLDGRDLRALAFLVCDGGYALAGAVSGALDWRWFPTVAAPTSGAYGASVLAAWLALCALPLILEGWEAMQWKRSTSNI